MTRTYTFHDQASHPDQWFCSTEQVWKPKSEFNMRDKERGLPQWDCRDCQQKRAHDRYANNRNRVKTINRVSMLNAREENREYVFQYLVKHPCKDCGESNPQVLTFDHVKGVKNGNISDMVNNGKSLQMLKDEIGKCEVVCFNCHMRRERRRDNKKNLLG
jgi:hypothetical protein